MLFNGTHTCYPWACSTQACFVSVSLVHRPSTEIYHTCGTNYQTLHGDTDTKSRDDILWQSLQNTVTELFNDGEVDETIEIDISKDLEQMLVHAIDGIVHMLQ